MSNFVWTSFKYFYQLLIIKPPKQFSQDTRKWDPHSCLKDSWVYHTLWNCCLQLQICKIPIQSLASPLCIWSSIDPHQRNGTWVGKALSLYDMQCLSLFHMCAWWRCAETIKILHCLRHQNRECTRFDIITQSSFIFI